ncbi:uncharacterized protein LOC110448827 isoform X2 [Mizuhopecten yessoensis]|uniref:uncharacterized protein LOC110448827 isoform X2 n=1 Tax=Mizuhopecten yessoensis TaxID=6573 RepID=UPI000B458C9B|nr:uncharacterized protein LOC110448827 isoform X2 [Mizuhopecten yessoensis]
MADSARDECDRRNIVVLAVDTSEHSEWAFDWYSANFHKPGNKVLLLHCPENYINATTMSPGRVVELQREVEGKSCDLKHKFIEKANRLGIEAEFKVESAEKPGHAIVEAATKHEAAFIVTGTRGMGKIRRTILGSVSDFVVHHAPCPVLVCRHKDK